MLKALPGGAPYKAFGKPMPNRPTGSAFSSDWFLAVVFQLRSNWLLHQQSHGTYDSFRILFFWALLPYVIGVT
jgi:hypothetical protein